MLPRLMLMTLAPLALAACDVTLTPGQLAYDDLADETNRLRAEFAGVAPTTPAQLPLFGTTTYDGTVLLDLATASDTSLLGEAEVVANFSADRVFGRFDNFVGSLNGGTVQAFDGFLSTTDGEIDVTETNVIQADLGGVLQGGGNVIGVDGTLVGNFLGPRDPLYPAGLEAKAGTGTRFTVNGFTVGGGISVIAED